MLQAMNNSIVELTTTVPALNSCIQNIPDYYVPYHQYMNYPVYVYTDKTKKAIEILKMLQAEGLTKLESVPQFINMVDKISSLL